MSITVNNANELMQSIGSYDVEKVAKLVQEGADLEKTDPEKGQTPLLFAIRLLGKSKETNEKLECIIKTLLDAKANINHMDNYGQTVLHLLIRDGSRIDKDTCHKILMEFINRGIKLDLCLNQKTHTALMQAITFWKFDLALLLIQNGANVNYVGSDYLAKYETRNALMTLVNTCHDGKDIQRQLKVLEALIAANANLNLADHNGRNVLFNVLNIINSKFSNQLLTILLKHDINVQQKDNHDNTPISEACKYGNISSILMMIDKINLSKKEDIEKLFSLLAQFGCVKGLQKLYDLGVVSKELMKDTFRKLGKLDGTMLLPTLFGYCSQYFFEINQYYTPLILNIKWFLKYMESDALLNIRTGRRSILAVDLNTVNFEHTNARKMLELQFEIHRLIVDLMTEELLNRFDIEFRSIPEQAKNKDLLFLHPSRDLKEMSEIMAKSSFQTLFPDKKEFLDYMQSKEMRKKQVGSLPYWCMANRSKEFSNFKFSELSQPLKSKIMSYLEPKPLAVNLEVTFTQLLNNRLNLVQEKVTERENQRKNKS